MNKFYHIFKNYCIENNIVSEFVRFHPLYNNQAYSPGDVKNYPINETVVVDLSWPPDEIWENFTSACRNKIRKARRFGVKVSQDLRFENLDRFHELYINTMERLKAQPYYHIQKNWLYRLVELLSENVALFHAKYEDRIIMSAIFLISNQFVHYFLSGSDDDTSHIAANNLLLYEVALWAKNRGKEVLHLGGGLQPRDNLFQFKASFSPLRATFFVGKAIHNAEIYEELCRRKRVAEEGHAIDSDFFPKYRFLGEGSAYSKPHPVNHDRTMLTFRREEAFNILFTNVGRRVSLIRAFRKTMADMGISGKILGIDSNPLAPAYHVTDRSFSICRITDKEYIPTLLELCLKEKINLLISLLDTDLLKLSENRQLFAQHGIFALISSPEVVRIARDKYLTRQFFEQNGIPTPRILSYEEAWQRNQFPLFIKPKDGSASLLTFRIDNPKSLEFFQSYVPTPMIQEFIPGDEYTLDIFIDIDGTIRAIVPRKRLEVRSGEVSKSQISLDPKILEVGHRVADALSRKGGLGPINAQCMFTPDREVKFIEINPRFGGGTPLSLSAGYPFPEWIIEMVLGRKVSDIPDGLGNGLTMLRYDDAVFIRLPGNGL